MPINDPRILTDFLTDDGRRHTIPARRARLLVVLTREAGHYWRSGGTVDA